MNDFAKHLSYKKQVNLGSFYSPKKYVDLVKLWMHEYAINGQYTIIDSKTTSLIQSIQDKS